MAKFQVTNLTLLLWTTLLVMVVALCATVTLAGPAPPPSPSAAFFHNCEIKIARCGAEVYNSVFHNAPISPNCCRNLVLMGKPCHDALVNLIISQPGFKGNKTLILESSNRTWNTCFAAAPRAPLIIVN